MGAREKNFYNELFQRYGWDAEAKEIQDLFLSGHREEAIAKVPDEYVDLATLAGDPGYVRDRIGAFKDIGVTYLNINVVGEEPLKVFEQVKAWARVAPSAVTGGPSSRRRGRTRDTIATTSAPTARPTTADASVLTSHPRIPPMPGTSWTCSSSECTSVVGTVPAELVGADQQDVPADPEHRGGADHGQPSQQLRHAGDQPAPDPLRPAALRTAPCAGRRRPSSRSTRRPRTRRP